MWSRVRGLLLSMGCLLAGVIPIHADEPLTAPEAGLPAVAVDGQPLLLDFETGNLNGWVAEGEAFVGQPVEGDTVAARRSDMHSRHLGRFWIGTYERAGDGPQGTLTSAPFKLDRPFASFYIAGGRSEATCVEIVRAADGQVVFRAAGDEVEDLAPVVVDLTPQRGQEMFVRLVDRSSGGWGHINFDHFRLHEARPRFERQRVLAPQDEYAHAGLDPEAAAAAMTAPPGFQVTLFAGEPDVVQPIAMCFDDRGRLWVAEAYSYPHRLAPDKARDRILIFEDTNGDGRFDARKVFAEKLNLVSGLEWGFGGVWVGAAPELLFIPDRDGDDRPDGPAEVLLDGWGYQDTHETLNTFTWGPDGWLYGCHGVFTHSLVGKPGTPKANRVGINAGVWRYHPQRHEFEVFAHGTSNPWGIAFNEAGQCFITACVIPHLYHLVPGGRYQRQAGAHFNRHTYADIQTIADHFHWLGERPHAGNDRSDAAGGGHAHAGALVYQADAWPEEFRGSLLMNNIHGARLNRDLLVSSRSGYVGKHAPDFLLANDRWSQIVGLQLGPDGQVYMIDWYDKNQCHRPESDIHDRSNGRVFRVAYGKSERPKVDLSAADGTALAALQLDANQWWVTHARRRLQERGSDARTHAALAEIAFTNADPMRRLRGLWALHASAGLDAPRLSRALADANEHVRGWAVRLASERGMPDSPFAQKLVEMAAADASPVVRLELACAVGRWPAAARFDLLANLLAHADDADDVNLPLLCWYAAEPLAELDRARALRLAENGRFPLVLEFMVRRIAEEGDEAVALLVDALARRDDAADQRLFLDGISMALRGQRHVKAPAGWDQVWKKLKSAHDPEVAHRARRLAVTFGSSEALETLRLALVDPGANEPDRLAALEALLAVKDPDLASLLQVMLVDGQLRGAVIRGLAQYDEPRTPEFLLDTYPQLSAAERRDAVNTLASRPSYALSLLDALAAGKVDRADITADVVRNLRNFKDTVLHRRIEETWGVVRDTPLEKARQISAIKRLVARAEPPADVARGRAVFAKTCQQCHKLFGQGAVVGPELTGSNRADLDYLLSNVLDPSAVMAKEYIPSVLVLHDGRLVTALVREETDAALTVVTANETLVLPKAEIDERHVAEKSMMPDDLLAPLTEDDIRALVAYLGSPRQTPLLATAENLPLLFNGRDLSLWNGNSALWSVEAGEIIGRSQGLDHNEFLVSELALDDFRLSVEVLLKDNRGNSGIQLRSQPLDDGEVRGYQADIGPGWWGKLYEEQGRGLLGEPAEEPKIPPGSWVKYEIAAEGNRVRTWLDGQLCVDRTDDAAARRGVLAFQLHAGEATEVRFRNLAVELLPATHEETTRAAK